MKYRISMLGNFLSCTSFEGDVCTLEKVTRQKLMWYYPPGFDKCITELLTNKCDV